MSSRIRVHVACRQVWKLPFEVAGLRDLLARMLYAAGLPEAEVELSLLDDAAMAELHWRSLSCKGPTNILSFPADMAAPPEGRTRKDGAGEPGPGHGCFLGWMALSVDTCLRECFLYGQDGREHCIRLLAHGLAHLIGHDHGPAMDAVCQRLENSV